MGGLLPFRETTTLVGTGEWGLVSELLRFRMFVGRPLLTMVHAGCARFQARRRETARASLQGDARHGIALRGTACARTRLAASRSASHPRNSDVD